MEENKQYNALPSTYEELAEEYFNNRDFYIALKRIALSIVSETELNNILDTVLNQINKIIPYSSANIMLYEKGILKTIRWKGYDNFGAEDFISDFSLEVAKTGKIPYSLKRKEVELVAKTTFDPEWKEFQETSYIESVIIAPLLWENNPIGIMFLDSDKPNTFNKTDVEKLNPLLSFVTVAIHNSKLLNDARGEINRRKEAEKNLQQSLQMQEVLTREINHRVKNNLSVILALIHMQGDKLYDRYHENLLDNLERRVYAISLIHEKFIESTELDHINLKLYLHQILEFTRGSVNHREDIVFILDVSEDTALCMDILLPLGLIVSEIVSNSLEYAFSTSGGRLTIKGSEENGIFHIEIKDTGTGFPPEFIGNIQPDFIAGVGFKLIYSLADQIKGTVVFSNQNGAVSKISFPV